MKTHLSFLLILFCILGGKSHAQTVYNFTIGEIYEATKGGGAGIRLPDGTVVKAEFVATTRSGVNQATPTMGVDMFKTGNGKSSGAVVNWLGGEFDNSPGGTVSATDGAALPTYQGSTKAAKFTTIQANNAFGIERGFTTDFGGSVGVRLFFNKATKFTNFLFIDIDGKDQAGVFANKEWATAFGYRDDKYVPMTLTTSGAGSNLGAQLNVPITNDQGWKAMLIDKLPLDAHKDFPNPYDNVLAHVDNGGEATGDADPDVLANQFVATTKNGANATVTDFFILFGIAGNVDDEGDNFARSGMGPLALTVEADFGDAPDSYKTLLKNNPANNGPSHGIISQLKLGATEASDDDGHPGAGNAQHDTDDDGISSSATISRSSNTTYSLTTSFTNNTESNAHFAAWLDWNNNGVFNVGEGVTATKAAAITTGSVTFTWTNFTMTNIPVDLKTFARIRVSTEDITTSDVGGAFIDGEVEDYQLTIEGSLPVTLVSLEAKAADKSITLNWKTANEKDFSHFDILKSADAKEFKSIGAIDGSSRGNYDFTDYEPANGNNYYRLKMVDTDGSFDLSRVVNVNFEANKTFLIAENPTKGGIFNVSTNALNPNFEIFTTSGSRVDIMNSASADANTYTLKVKKPAAGLYILKMTGNGKALTKKIIIP